MKSQARLVDFLLFLLLAGFILWQGALHRQAARDFRRIHVEHARDVSKTLSVVIRSQGRFHVITRDRLEAALQEVASTGQFLSVAFQSPSGETTAAAGAPLDAAALGLPLGSPPEWRDSTLTLVDLVSLGSGVDRVAEQPPPGPPPGETTGIEKSTPAAAGEAKPGEPKPGANGGMIVIDRPPEPPREQKPESDEERRERMAKFREWRQTPSGQRPPYPPWMSREEFDNLYNKQGLHRFVMRLDASETESAIRRDLLLRLCFGIIAAAALAGLMLWRRGLARTTELRVRLARVQEMNQNLRDMNTASAGLAHETRNPLNRIRGLSQLIADTQGSAPEVLQRASLIVEEVDRIAGRLHEFIEFSRPREPVLQEVALDPLLKTLLRTLEADIQEKEIQVDLQGTDLRVEADENLLRRLLFNLLLNAIQAVPQQGRILVSGQVMADRLSLVVADNGPGIPEGKREQIFQPYVSLNEQGTGLGLAIVRQISLAHHWDVTVSQSTLGGAAFTLANIRPAGKRTESAP